MLNLPVSYTFFSISPNRSFLEKKKPVSQLRNHLNQQLMPLYSSCSLNLIELLNLATIPGWVV